MYPDVGLKWGVEREALRLDQQGNLAETCHPSTLQNPWFTRDFAESQLEIITQPHTEITKLMEELHFLTEKAKSSIGSETLWPFSMPPNWSVFPNVRLAAPNREEEIYRMGLANRYGLSRQLISGIHINVSFTSSFASHTEDLYLKTVRFLYTRLPLMILLTGASPFSPDHPEIALSWRNSPQGYAGTTYRRFLHLDSLASYVKGIEQGLKQESAAYRHFRLWDGKGRTQLNNRIFQSEKEFYAPIRIKGEKGLADLKRGRISRMEIRIPDVNPYQVTGVSEETLHLLQLLILQGALNEHRITEWEINEALNKADQISMSNPVNFTAPVDFHKQLKELLPIAESLDRASGTRSSIRTLNHYQNQLDSKEATLSGRMVRDFHGYTGGKYALAI